MDLEFARAREFIGRFDPELVVLFGPDHYNGFFYDLMPSFCVGAAATAIGDYYTPAGALSVDRETAYSLVRATLASEVDVCVSERMYVDHGFAQPLQLLFGGIDRCPVVPVFINSIAVPLGPVRRCRLLGEAIGRAAADLGRRVLFVASGGLSHDPPLPSLEGASVEVASRLISEGRVLTAEQRRERQERVIAAGIAAVAGAAPGRPINPVWDRQFLDLLASGDLEKIDSWSTESFAEEGGNSAHEVRTWIAAYAALAASGPYQVVSSFYEPIPAWVAGFGITTAVPA